MTPQATAGPWEAYRLHSPMLSVDEESSSFRFNGPLRDLPPATGKPKLLDQVRAVMRLRHYSPRTEKTYVHWIKRYMFFHDKRHPSEMREAEIGQFLSFLATDSHVSAFTQNQALNAILFL